MTGKQRISRLRSWGATKFKQTVLIASAAFLAVGFNFLATLGSGKTAYADSGTGQITGTVMQNNGTPIAGATVKAFASAQAYYDGQTSANTTSATDGTYALTGLADGNYIVLFNDYSDPGSNHSWSWGFYNYSIKIPELANQVTVAGGGTTSGIEGYLLPAGQITGRVTDKQGNPLGGIKVGAYGNNEEFANNQELPVTTTTASDGTYTLQGLAAGVWDYSVLFNMSSADHYAQLWYNDVPSQDQSTGVSVAIGETHANIDAHLYKVGQISGHLTNQFGQSLSGISMNLFAQGADYGNGPTYETTTDASGNYQFTNVPEGTWFLDINDANQNGYNGSYSSQWYDTQYQEQTATPLVIVGGDNLVASTHLNRLVPTITVLSSSRNPSHVGQKVTFTAWAIPVTHGGMMTFLEDGQLMQGCAFTQFSGMKATCTTTFTTPGTHTITAIWPGDMTYKTSTSNTITQRILR